MNLYVAQHETYIIAPDDSAKIVHEAVLPPGQPKVVIPAPTNPALGILPNGNPLAMHRSNLHGLSLAWRGLNLLGIALGIATVWFVWEWFDQGRMPLGLSLERRNCMGGSLPSPILPPIWLGVILVPMAVISLCMLVLGTQDVIPKMKFKKDIKG
jgi:hypothetical protein